MNTIKRWLTVIFTLGYFNLSFCQLAELKTATTIQYGVMDSPFTWEKQMVGKLDDVFDIHLFLVTDTKSYHGAYQITQSKEIRYLEGEYNGVLITLFEYNEEGTLTGVITGDLNDYIFYGIRTDRNNTEEVSFVVYSTNYELNEDIGSNWVRSFMDNKNYVQIEKFNDNYTAKCDFDGNLINSVLECIDNGCKKFKQSEWSEEEESSILKLMILENAVSINNQDSININLPLTNLIRHKTKNWPLGAATSYEVIPDFQNPKLTKSWTKLIKDHFGELLTKVASNNYESSLDVIPDYLSASYYSGIIRFQDNQSADLKEVGFLIDFNKNRVQELTSLFPKGYNLTSIIKRSIKDMEEVESDSYMPSLNEFDIFSVDKNNLIVRSRMSLIYGQTILTIPLSNLPFKIIK